MDVCQSHILENTIGTKMKLGLLLEGIERKYCAQEP